MSPYFNFCHREMLRHILYFFPVPPLDSKLLLGMLAPFIGEYLDLKIWVLCVLAATAYYYCLYALGVGNVYGGGCGSVRSPR